MKCGSPLDEMRVHPLLVMIKFEMQYDSKMYNLIKTVVANHWKAARAVQSGIFQSSEMDVDDEQIR